MNPLQQICHVIQFGISCLFGIHPQLSQIQVTQADYIEQPLPEISTLKNHMTYQT